VAIATDIRPRREQRRRVRRRCDTVKVDVKDESGNVSFRRSAIARRDGAARAYDDPRAVAQQAHAAGMYLIAGTARGRLPPPLPLLPAPQL
jgi:hypothetical protein